MCRIEVLSPIVRLADLLPATMATYRPDPPDSMATYRPPLPPPSMAMWHSGCQGGLISNLPELAIMSEWFMACFNLFHVYYHHYGK